MATNAMATTGFAVDPAGTGKAQDPTLNSGISNGPGPGIISKPGQFTDQQLLDKWKRWKKESFDQRWIFERQWMRNIWYVLNRQWIYFDVKRGQWQDKRLAKWIPRPVSNFLKEGVQSIRANFASINYGANARPLGDDPTAITTASVADDMLPILHEDHRMNHVMNVADFWMLTTGNAWLHPTVDYSWESGSITVQHETCMRCGVTSPETDIAKAGQACPACKSQDFMPAMDGSGNQISDQVAKPKPTTYPLSPFELAFPIMYDFFEKVPYLIMMRWRDRSFYEQDAEMVQMGYDKSLAFNKSPQERTMQIFKTLPFQSDLGIAPPYFASGGANVDSEGVVEYDVWVKPCKDFPEGQVIRIASDGNPTIIHSEKENLPGPLPFKTATGDPIFPFYHYRYDHVGGRIYGSSLIDPAIQKQDQINQVDSHFLMTLGRMANPIWLEPKGAEVEKFTGEPGLVVKWNPLIANGQAKPERIAGEGIQSTWFSYREMLKNELEELMGTLDILKGEKPSGVEAYSAMALLLERGQARHASAYQSRGDAYKGWAKNALELEREFGPENRTRAIMMPNRGWSFQQFQSADLSGNVELIIEDGTLAPKTSLGERAAIDHLFSLQLIDPGDPDMRTAIFQQFGQSKLMPGIDAQVQEAWRVMDAFEKFMGDPQAIQQAQQQGEMAAQQAAMTGQPAPPVGPLVYKRWYNAQIHRNELIKWCLSDRGRQTFAQHPAAEQLVEAYLAQIDMAISQGQMGMLDAAGIMLPTQPQQGGPPGGGQAPGGGAPGTKPPPKGGPQSQGAHGAGGAMRMSNKNSAGVGPSASGSGSPIGGTQPPIQQ